MTQAASKCMDDIQEVLITEQYREQNRLLHEQREDYGANAKRWASVVVEVCKGMETRDVLDYGCGKGSLRKALPMVDVKNYDPAIEQWAAPPKPADIVCVLDVLEHIEPDCLEAVLQDIARLALKSAIFVINTKKAIKTLPDGRNTHLLVRPKIWWANKLDQYFEITQFNKVSDREMLCICANKLKTEEKAE